MNFDLTLEFQKLFADANAFDKFDDIFLPGWHGYRYFSLDNPPPEKKVQSIGKKKNDFIRKIWRTRDDQSPTAFVSISRVRSIHWRGSNRPDGLPRKQYFS